MIQKATVLFHNVRMYRKSFDTKMFVPVTNAKYKSEEKGKIEF